MRLPKLAPYASHFGLVGTARKRKPAKRGARCSISINVRNGSFAAVWLSDRNGGKADISSGGANVAFGHWDRLDGDHAIHNILRGETPQMPKRESDYPVMTNEFHRVGRGRPSSMFTYELT